MNNKKNPVAVFLIWITQCVPHGHVFVEKVCARCGADEDGPTLAELIQEKNVRGRCHLCDREQPMESPFCSNHSMEEKQAYMRKVAE